MLKSLWVSCLLSTFTASSIKVTFIPETGAQVRTHEIGSVLVKIEDLESSSVSISAECEDVSYCKVLNPPENITVNENKTAVWNITIQGNFLGLTDMTVRVEKTNTTYPLRILRSQRGQVAATIFWGFVKVFICFVTFMMGTQLKIHQIFNILKKPIGPLIGFICQFGLMPLIGFVVANYGLSSFDSSYQLALFAVATCPGGGKSSFWTIIFGGNLDLSISMTFFQTIAALFMMPIWLNTLGTHFMNVRLTIPSLSIIRTLILFVVPTSLGIVFTYFCPLYVNVIQKWIKRVSWASMIILTIAAIYTNFYMIYFINVRLFICACALPWLGYLLAFILATVLQQDFKNAATIAIEAGIQNVGIAFVLIDLCLPEPESNISMTIIFVMAIMTDKPLVLIWLCNRLYRRLSNNETKRFFNSKRMAIDEEDDSGMELQEKETKVDVNDNSVISA